MTQVNMQYTDEHTGYGYAPCLECGKIGYLTLDTKYNRLIFIHSGSKRNLRCCSIDYEIVYADDLNDEDYICDMHSKYAVQQVYKNPETNRISLYGIMSVAGKNDYVFSDSLPVYVLDRGNGEIVRLLV